MRTFNLPPLPPPHCLDNGPNNQHNCREKFLFFYFYFFLKVPTEAGCPWLLRTFHQVRGSRQSSLCCQTLPLSNLPCKEERQKVLFKIYIDSLQRERKRGADWFLRDFFLPSVTLCICISYISGLDISESPMTFTSLCQTINTSLRETFS